MRVDYTKNFYNFNRHFEHAIREYDFEIIRNIKAIDITKKNAIGLSKGFMTTLESYNFAKIKQSLYKKLHEWGGLDDIEIYSYLLEESFNYNEDLTDSFMLSDHGGYSLSELKQIKFDAKNNFGKLKYELIRTKCLAEIEFYGYLGDFALLSFMLSLFDLDMTKAREFMISKYGGYSKTQATRFKSDYNRFQRIRMEKYILQ